MQNVIAIGRGEAVREQARKATGASAADERPRTFRSIREPRS